MPKNEDGEFELVLGNKQLLSMFFVVVILLGVFFVMGYIVGRNSAPQLTADTARKPDTKPLVVDSPAPKPAAPDTSTSPATPGATEKPSPEKSSPAATEPAKSVPVTKAEPPKSEPAKTEAPKAEAKATKARPVAQSNQPVAGATYLQLSATSKRDADAMVEELRKNGFSALDAEVPEKQGTFRVLVGPIASGDLNKTKTELQAKSFPGNAAIKKTF